MSATVNAVENYTAAFNAQTYKIQLKSRRTEEGFWVEYTPAQLVKAVGYLRSKNANGFDVYARPVGWQYVLLDDLTRDVLADVASLKPCLLIETSPGNFQAWLTLSELPAERETAKAICRELAVRFRADLASAEPDHVGRLPGFTNRKPKYQMLNGQYPFVKLHRWENRLSNFYPCGGPVLNNSDTSYTNIATRLYNPNKGSASEQDFGIACGLVRAGKTDNEILQHLISMSPNLLDRKGKYSHTYLQRTINNARRIVTSNRV